jgi:hypothetical protein
VPAWRLIVTGHKKALVGVFRGIVPAHRASDKGVPAAAACKFYENSGHPRIGAFKSETIRWPF